MISIPNSPGFGWTIRRSVRLIWENLGLVVLISALTTIAALPAISLTIVGLGMPPVHRLITLSGAFLCWVLLVPSAQFAGAELALRAIRGEERDVFQFFKAFKQGYVDRLGIGAIRSIFYPAVFANVQFYFHLSKSAGLISTVVAFYALSIWLVWGMYLYAVKIYAPRIESDALPSTNKLAWLFVASSVAYSFGMLAMLLVVTIALGVTGIGLALLAPGIWAMVSAQATYDQFLRFSLIKDDLLSGNDVDK
ncbi:MAG: hypothetical protein ABJA67_15980 [Chthonomonadales bacterium]